METYISVKAHNDHDLSLDFSNTTEEEVPKRNMSLDYISEEQPIHIEYHEKNIDDSIKFNNESSDLHNNENINSNLENVEIENVIEEDQKESINESSNTEEELNASVEEYIEQEIDEQDQQESFIETNETLDETENTEEELNETEEIDNVKEEEDENIDDLINEDYEEHVYDDEPKNNDEDNNITPPEDEEHISHEHPNDYVEEILDETSNPITLISTCFILLTLGALIL